MKKLTLALLLTSLFLPGSAQKRLPDPRFELEVYGSVIFVNPDGSTLYNSTKAYTQFLTFTPQKEFGSSPMFGIRIMYPGKDGLWLGMDVAYVRSLAVNRYADIYGQYDLEVIIKNASYQFLLRYAGQGRHALGWYAQAGAGPSYLLENRMERITSNLEQQDLQTYTREEESYGWSLSLGAGLRWVPGRISVTSAAGYRYTIHEGDAYVRGLSVDFGIGINLMK